MRRKLTITLDQEVYDGLHATVGRGRISQFIESVVRPCVVVSDLAAGYEEMAQDAAHEREATEWIEALIGDVADEPR